MKKLLLVGVALLSIPSHACDLPEDFNSMPPFTLLKSNNIKTIIPIIKDTTYKSLSEEKRNIIDTYIRKTNIIASLTPRQIRNYPLKYINIEEIKIDAEIKSLISNLPSFKQLNDWCSQNEIEKLDFYRFLQNTSELFLNITPQSKSWNKDYPFPWNIIFEEHLYSRENGFDPLAIAVILPYLSSCNRTRSDQARQIFGEFDTLKISHLIKGMIDYTIDTIKDLKIFNEYTVPTIAGSLRKLNFLEKLNLLPDEKKSLINMINEKGMSCIRKCHNCVKKEDPDLFADFGEALGNGPREIVSANTDAEIITNYLNFIKNNLNKYIQNYITYGGIFAYTKQDIISALQIVYQKEELQEQLNTIVKEVTTEIEGEIKFVLENVSKIKTFGMKIKRLNEIKEFLTNLTT